MIPAHRGEAFFFSGPSFLFGRIGEQSWLGLRSPRSDKPLAKLAVGPGRMSTELESGCPILALPLGNCLGLCVPVSEVGDFSLLVHSEDQHFSRG